MNRKTICLKSTTDFVFILAAVATITLLISGCGPSEKQVREESEKKAKAAETAQIETLKLKALDLLSDPASVQFRKITLLQGNRGLCGELNAKNKVGGYVGFSAFAVNTAGKAIILQTMTLELAKQDEASISKLAVKMYATHQAQAESLVMDNILKKDFLHWNECEN